MSGNTGSQWLPNAPMLDEVAALEEKVPPEAEPELQPMGRGKLTFRRFMRNKLAVIGVVVLVIMVLVAIFGPSVWRWNYLDQDFTAFLKGPSAAHPMGTTGNGRDIMAMLMFGMRKSLAIGIIYALLVTAIETLTGAAAAYFGSWVERVILWVTDLLLIVPQLLLVAIIMWGLVSPVWSWLFLALLMGVLDWPMGGRIVRSLTISLKNREYVQAARFMGLSSWRIIFRHILPNISSLLIVNVSMGVGLAILAETTYAYLGFGVQPPDISLGALIADGSTKATTFPWEFGFSAVALVIVVLAVNAIGDGLRDALDPTSAAGGQA